MNALTWNDVDFVSKTIRINKNLVHLPVKNGTEEKHYEFITQNSTKTKSGNRVIPLSMKAIEALEQLKKQTGEDPYIITSKNHIQIAPSRMDRTFNCILRNVGISKQGEQFGVHDIRHTFASMLFSNGCDVKIVSELLGHVDTKITENIYIHLIQQQKVNAIQSIDLYSI